jgi:Holliday junction resolvase-like predicted endonuclease
MLNKYVKKAAGDIEPFSKKKLARFLRRIQVPTNQIDPIVNEVQMAAGEEIFTNQIALLVTNKLLRLENGETYAARYNLKRAIRHMGPAGHIFEKYVGKLFEADGYKVQVAIVVQGECVEHEIDVFAEKDNELHIVEAKFHNQEGTRSEVTTALYVYARFLDVAKRFMRPGHTEHVWIATNTKLTTTAFKYASCKGINVLSIEQPHSNSIMDQVIRDGFFPISSIDLLHRHWEALYQEDIIILDDLMSMSLQTARRLQIPEQTLNEAQMQAARILDFTRSTQIHLV